MKQMKAVVGEPIEICFNEIHRAQCGRACINQYVTLIVVGSRPKIIDSFASEARPSVRATCERHVSIQLRARISCLVGDRSSRRMSPPHGPSRVANVRTRAGRA